ncbi:MAG: choice-of-anchor Q domain-containing protein [Pyrinomonadaceae bacterium]
MKYIFLTLALVAFAFSTQAFAADFTVNLTSGSGNCLVSGGPCTLDQAISQANSLATNDTITFDLPANSTITLSGQLSISNNGTLSIIGSGANNLTIDGGPGLNRVFSIDGSTVLLSGLTMTGGNGKDDPGGLSGGVSGGAIRVVAGSLTLNGVHINQNSAAGNFGQGDGGGISQSGGTLSIINSTISNNISTDCGGISNGGTMTVVNSTISNNSVRRSGFGLGFIGGGVCNFGTATLRNVTVTRNSGAYGSTGGGSGIYNNGSLIFSNSIIAGNILAVSGPGPDIRFQSGTITSEGGNLVGDSADDSFNTGPFPITYHFTDLRDINPMFGLLQNNGGPTPTNALLFGSPAVNAAINVALPATDQRGVIRPVGGASDIGAFELQNLCSVSIGPTSHNFGAEGGNVTFNVTADTGCSWTSTSSAGWLSITAGNAGTGNGSVTLAAAVSDGPERSATISIAGLTFTVNQTNGCVYSISPLTTLVPNEGGTGMFTLTTGVGCSSTFSETLSWVDLSVSTFSPGPQTFTYTVSANNGNFRSGVMTVAGLTFTVYQESIYGFYSLFDYDLDARADLSVFRPSDNKWYVLRGTAGYMEMEWGEAGDAIVPADYDGDGKTDVSVFRPSTGEWYIYRSGTQTFQISAWGASGDIPVPSDRDGDRKADLVLYRPSNNTWYTKFALNNTFSSIVFGTAGDKPVIGNFDGDNKFDIGVYRPSDHNWYILKSSVGYTVQTWGEDGDIPVPADYDGDGATDIAVFRPSTGQWFRIRSSSGFDILNWGTTGDKPIPADYDSDGKADVAVFRPSNGTWYIVGSTAGQIINAFGQNGDLPTQAAFIY